MIINFNNLKYFSKLGIILLQSDITEIFNNNGLACICSVRNKIYNQFINSKVIFAKDEEIAKKLLAV